MKYSYTPFWKKNRVLRTVYTAFLILTYPIVITVMLWVEYWEDDVKDGFLKLCGILRDWRTK